MFGKPAAVDTEEGLEALEDVVDNGTETAEIVDLAEVREAVEQEGAGVEDSDYSADEMEAAEKENRAA